MSIGAMPADPGYDRAQLQRMLANEADMAFRRRAEAVFDFLAIRPGDRVLDLGCGRGFFLNLLRELAPAADVVGAEIDRPLLSVARSRLPNVRAVNASAYDLPFAAGTFDKILFTEVLEHIPDDLAAVREVARVLAPGAAVALTTPNADYPFAWDPINKVLEATLRTHIQTGPLAGIWANHVRLYTPESLVRLVADAGLVVDEVRCLTRYCFPFIHNLVYGVGKPLLERGLLPESVSAAADRFDLETKGGSGFNPVRIGLWLFNQVDRLNELYPPTFDRSFLIIALRAHKPETAA